MSIGVVSLGSVVEIPNNESFDDEVNPDHGIETIRKVLLIVDAISTREHSYKHGDKEG